MHWRRSQIHWRRCRLNLRVGMLVRRSWTAAVGRRWAVRRQSCAWRTYGAHTGCGRAEARGRIEHLEKAAAWAKRWTKRPRMCSMARK